jgi:hypothetical protein
MSRPDSYPTPSGRQQAWSRVRTLTRASVLAATGLTALIGVVIAKEHAGSSSNTAAAGNSGGSTGATTTTVPPTSESDDSGNTGNSGSTSSGTAAPSITFSRPSVTSGGSSR